MKESINLFTPVLDKKSIDIAKQFDCRGVYINCCGYPPDINLLADYVSYANAVQIPIFLNLQNNLMETWGKDDTLDLLLSLKTQGYIVNDLTTADLIKHMSGEKVIIAGPGLNVHNIEMAKMLSKWKFETYIVTEEVNLKNMIAIKKVVNKDIAVIPNNLLTMINDVIKNNIQTFFLFDSLMDQEALKNVLVILTQMKGQAFTREQITALQKIFSKTKGSQYSTNHFTEEFITPNYTVTKLGKQVRKYKPSYEEEAVDHWGIKVLHNHLKDQHIKLKLKINRLDQLEFIQHHYDNFLNQIIDSVEYSELIPPYDLAENSFKEIIKHADKMCRSLQLKLSLSTPAILIERDFDRVYTHVRESIFASHAIDTLVINNLGFFWKIIHDHELSHIRLVLGKDLQLTHCRDYNLLAQYTEGVGIDCPQMNDFHHLKAFVSSFTGRIEEIRYTIAGLHKLKTSGLCPLNNFLPHVSRITCPAPCHNGNFSIQDPDTGRILPMVLDGFCRLHLFDHQLYNQAHAVEHLKKIGINTFMIDMTGIDTSFMNIWINDLENLSSTELCYDK